MTKRTVKIGFELTSSSYKVSIGGDLKHVGRWAQTCLKRGGGRVVIVSNPKVFKLYGGICERSFQNAGFSVSTFLIKDGERHKTLKTAEAALLHFSKTGLTRSDSVAALGGGVVGDLAGFAASVYLRGVPFLQIPTSLLAMIDSSVGGKTAVNTAFGKNLIGSFHQPRGVFIDISTLSTLPPREIRAGLFEMTKHGVLSGRKLLKETHDFLIRTKDGQHPDISGLLAKNIEFKARIVAGDELELVERTDPRSRKILNFGHTLGHALEKATNYCYFKHGEAVGYGILYAAAVSKSLALLNEKDVNLLNDVVKCVGPLPALVNIETKKVLEAFEFDKKNLAGSHQMVLLKGIGRPVMIDQIPKSLMQKTLKQLFKENGMTISDQE